MWINPISSVYSEMIEDYRILESKGEREMIGSNRRAMSALVIAVTLAVGILVGTVVSHGVRAAKGSSGGAEAKPLSMPSPIDLSNSFSQIADKVEDSVVNINTETTVTVAHRSPHAQEGSPFDDFFDRFFSRPAGRAARWVG